jgi:hypothetical protein
LPYFILLLFVIDRKLRKLSVIPNKIHLYVIYISLTSKLSHSRFLRKQKS